jgi:hypothetical protein
MPWSKKQVRTAEAVKHGWKPQGSAKGFTHSFASQVVSEGERGGMTDATRKAMRRHLKVQSSR